MHKRKTTYYRKTDKASLILRTGLLLPPLITNRFLLNNYARLHLKVYSPSHSGSGSIQCFTYTLHFSDIYMYSILHFTPVQVPRDFICLNINFRQHLLGSAARLSREYVPLIEVFIYAFLPSLLQAFSSSTLIDKILVIAFFISDFKSHTFRNRMNNVTLYLACGAEIRGSWLTESADYSHSKFELLYSIYQC